MRLLSPLTNRFWVPGLSTTIVFLLPVTSRLMFASSMKSLLPKTEKIEFPGEAVMVPLLSVRLTNCSPSGARLTVS